MYTAPREKNDPPQNEQQNEQAFAKIEPSFTAPAVVSAATEKQAEPSFIPQAEKKRFTLPVFEEEKDNSTSTAPAFAAKPVGETIKEPAKTQEPAKEKKISFREKILEAQKAQAESRERDDIPKAQEKIIPVDAENIIRAPLKDVAPDFSSNFTDEQIDYSEDEERLATSAYTEEIDTPLAHHLFDENTIPEEAKEPLDWQAFLAYCEEHDFPVEYIPLMQGLTVILTKKNCHVKVSSGPQATIFNKVKNQLQSLLCTFLGREVNIQVTIVAYELVSDEKLREKASNNSQIKLLMKEFGAEIYRCYDIKHERKN